MKLAFIGLGRMGSPIARNLLAAGHEVTVFNRTAGKTKELTAQGAHAAPSIELAARDCEAALTMLSDDAALLETTLSSNGLAGALPPGAIHVSLSTVGVPTAKRLTLEHASRNQTLVSAPVFGRPDAAAAKRLLVVLAGESSAVAKIQPLAAAIGRAAYIVGTEPWQANLLKLNGNFMIACMMETFGEAFATVRKAGIDHRHFFEIMSELFASPVYKNYGGAIVDEAFSPAGFALKLGLKDIRLGLEAAAELNSPMPFASILRDHLLTALAHGQQDLDWSSIALVSARAAGLPAKTHE